MKDVQPLLGRAPLEDFLDQRDQRLPVSEAIGVGGEARVSLPLGPSHRPAEQPPELLGEDGDDQRAVAGLEGLVGDDRGMARAQRARHLAVGPEVLGQIREERDLGVQEREVDDAPLPCPLAVKEGSGDRKGAEHPARQVSYRQPHPHRRAALLAGDAHRPTHGLEGQVEGRPVAVGALLPVGRDRAADEPRVEGAEARGVTPELGHNAGPEVIPHHVRDADQIVEHLAPFGLRQIQRHALLVPVDGEEVGALPIGKKGRPHDPHRVPAVRLLDLQHLRPKVGHQHGAVRPGQHPGEVQHPHAGEQRHSITLSAQIRIDCGIVRPSALAVLRFTTSSNFVGCSTGRSPGFAPLRILST